MTRFLFNALASLQVYGLGQIGSWAKDQSRVRGGTSLRFTRDALITLTPRLLPSVFLTGPEG